ncbi:uracil phosphoribosyltransferase [Caldivirga sp.]|uniref:uracil phosphoribosyltransferase n=1 Tax=Caldivirga sp. TaxID=2080243 RepID=UPI0025BED0F1|nr:uracil phosphoribosyltransferase [Caldivirga sp.]
MGKVVIVDHPLAQDILTTLRDKGTGQIEFRKGLVRLGRLIGYEIIKSFETYSVEVETPLGVKARGVRIKDVDKVIIVQVLRAAMPMVEGLLKAFPAARIGVVSARRVENTHVPGSMEFQIDIGYYRIPEIHSDDTLIVVDPMLATGSTILSTLDIVYRHGKPKRTITVHVIGTRYAIERILAKYPNIDVYLVAVDPELNERGFIVPGLGDAGDRAYGEA